MSASPVFPVANVSNLCVICHKPVDEANKKCMRCGERFLFCSKECIGEHLSHHHSVRCGECESQILGMTNKKTKEVAEGSPVLFLCSGRCQKKYQKSPALVEAPAAAAAASPLASPRFRDEAGSPAFGPAPSPVDHSPSAAAAAASPAPASPVAVRSVSAPPVQANAK